MSPTAADDREGGTILILTLGFLVVALLLVWAVIDASAVFLDRRDLAGAADSVALDAAQQVDVQAIYAHGATGELPLEGDAVDREVATFVAANYPVDRYPGWTFRGAVTGPHTVTVTGRRTVDLPGYGRVTVVAASSATDRTIP